jgi:hypothetical protein
MFVANYLHKFYEVVYALGQSWFDRTTIGVGRTNFWC